MSRRKKQIAFYAAQDEEEAQRQIDDAKRVELWNEFRPMHNCQEQISAAERLNQLGEWCTRMEYLQFTLAQVVGSVGPKHPETRIPKYDAATGAFGHGVCLGTELEWYEAELRRDYEAVKLTTGHLTTVSRTRPRRAVGNRAAASDTPGSSSAHAAMPRSSGEPAARPTLTGGKRTVPLPTLAEGAERSHAAEPSRASGTELEVEPEVVYSDTEWDEVESEGEPEPTIECEYASDESYGDWDIPTGNEPWDLTTLAMCYEIVADVPGIYIPARQQFRSFLVPQRKRKLATVHLRWPTNSTRRSDQSAASVLRLYKALQ